MHELYRCNFNSVDVFNKLALGPNSLCNVLGTKIWWRRVWMGILGVCETNAYLAYCKTVEKIPRHAFREQLAYHLLRFGGYQEVHR
jgi:hypothetical protein